MTAASLNNHQTMSCAMGKTECDGEPEASWQALLAASAPALPVFQDTAGGPIWDSFGAGHDDLMVYDRAGRLFAWLPSAATVRMSRMKDGIAITGPLSVLDPDLTTSDGFAAVRATVLLAASAVPERCLQTSTTVCAQAGGIGGTLAWLFGLVALGLLFLLGYVLSEDRKRRARLLSKHGDPTESEMG